MSERVAAKGLDPAVDQVLAEYEARAEPEERAMRKVPPRRSDRVGTSGGWRSVVRRGCC